MGRAGTRGGVDVAMMGASASLEATGALLLEDARDKGAVLEEDVLRPGASYCEDLPFNGAYQTTRISNDSSEL